MYQPEVDQIMELLKPEIIKAEVEYLRLGHNVKQVHIPDKWLQFAIGFYGSFNFHIKIEFDDGEFWMMRIRRRKGRDYPDGPLKLNLESEVATNRILHKAGLKVPHAHLRLKDSKFHPKLIYCYQTFMNGALWRPWYYPDTCDLPLEEPSIRLLNGIANWFLEMEKLKFDQVGSPCFGKDEDDIIIGPLISRHPVYTTPPYNQGPFKTAQDKWLAIIDNKISLILSRNYCTPDRELQEYFMLKQARELVKDCEEMENPGPFYIKHDDDRFDHIRAEEETGEFTGILDWEWAYTTNKEEAFAAPNGFVPADYKKGKNDILSTRELALIDAYTSHGRPDLAECVRKGRKYHRLIDFLRHDVYDVQIINALERAFLGLPDNHIGQPSTLEDWLEAMKEKFKDDEGLSTLWTYPVATLKLPEELKNP
ncbi:hypothetical protein I203_101106 [Kwoniella mangroviensis CBS 8507]|uniref:uncharacterized protein n=1 Tax=Kwoniella mangroviensis CBS 8507 TaxID=1296122 RepID=UPI00080D37CA|nr:uncharacterized protein I203_02740 [Kwoniella mangroviensis CBS 8507]OCF68081.1 hypothetical protein I203_02740 [Kwoniella mangroviensis CBS 8507]